MSEEKQRFWDREYTRRQFLKISGKSLAGLTITASMLSLFGCTQQQVEQEEVTTWALPQGLLVANAAKCTGCLRCEINCTMVNDGSVSSYMSRVKTMRNLYFNSEGQHGLAMGDFTFFPDTCRQCKDPACGNACPQKAIIADPATGARVVLAEKCIGCGACVQACPWHMPTVSPETQKSTKCISCGSCAAGCPTGALTIIPWEDVAAAV